MAQADAVQARAILEKMGDAGAEALAKITNVGPEWQTKGPTQWRWKLMEAITNQVQDPDVDVPRWFGGDTPLGINCPITPRGIFPPSPPTKAQRDSAEDWALRGGQVEVDRNYKSFHDNEAESTEELKRLVEEGHLEIIGPWSQVAARWPKAVGTKLATLVKVKADGSTKTRFVADMRRSGVNGLAKADERIILPRGSDLIRDTLDIMEVSGPEIEYFSADISDAFLNLGVTESERGFTVVRTTGEEYGSYRGVPFGLATAPLVGALGRMAGPSNPSRIRALGRAWTTPLWPWAAPETTEATW